MLESVRLLRAFAAVLVVYFHAQEMINSRIYPDFFKVGVGAVGVDIFFVISGFIMYYTSKDLFEKGESINFLKNRAIRIAPAYYLYTTIMVVLLLIAPQLFSNLTFDLSHIISSYFFILSENNEGIAGTVLGVGWTLAFEAFFYVTFALLMMKNRKYLIPGLGFFFLVGTLTGTFVQNLPAWTTVFTSPIVFEFLLGCFIGYLYTQKQSVGKSMSLFAIILGVLGIAYFTFNNYIDNYLGWMRLLTLGIPSAMLVYGLLNYEKEKKLPSFRFFNWIGDSSYSLYLIHSFILSGFGVLVAPTLYSYGLGVVGILTIAIGLSLIGGWLSFKLFELPTTRYLKKFINTNKNKAVPKIVYTSKSS